MDTVYKTFKGEVKGVDAEAGTIDMLIPMSTASVDRDNEIVEPSGFKKWLKLFLKRPVLVSSHNYGDLRKQIGELLKLEITDKGLMANGLKYYTGKGNDEADWAFYLASEGMAAFSIGFMPKKWEKIDEDKDDFFGNKRYTEQELLEISQVVVPSNRDAIQGARAKAAGDPVVIAMLDDIEKGLTGTPEPEGTAGDEGDGSPEVKEGEEAEPVTKPYPNEHACRLRDPGDFTPGSFRSTERTSGGKKYRIISGRLKEEETMTEQAYRYNKEVWEAAQARTHCKEHDGKFEAAAPKEVTQGQMQDDLDYLNEAINNSGLNEQTTDIAWEVVRSIMRLTGSDIPEDIRAVVGAEVTAESLELLEQAKAMIDEAKAKLNTPETEGDKPVEQPAETPKPKLEAADVEDIIKRTVARLTGKRIK